MDMSKLNALSDDMIGQLYFNTKRILTERGIDLAQLIRSQIRIGNVVTFTDNKGAMLTAIVTAISHKTASVRVVNPLNHEVDVPGGKWRVSFASLTLVEAVKNTNLAKKEKPVEPHHIQTAGGGDW